MDLNADLGESLGRWRLGDDAALLPLVSSANVACGFHAGDSLTLRRTCAEAARNGVTVGAQVSYRDLVGFGRRFIEMDPEELTADVLYQLGALQAMCLVAGTRVCYLKPHGALYNATVHHEPQAAAVVAAILAYDAGLPVLCLPGSALSRHAAAAGLRAVPEAFADRGYAADGTLVPRGTPGALITDPDEVARRALQIALDAAVPGIDGAPIPVVAESICIHGDSPAAVRSAAAVRAALARNGITVAPFVAG